MRLKNYFQKIGAVGVSLTASLLMLTSCSSYDYVSYDDGIYGDAGSQRDYKPKPNTTEEKPNYYSNYFSEKSTQIGNALEQDAIFTDIDSYATENYDPSDTTGVALDYKAGQPTWGSDYDEVSVNIYNNGWNNPYWGGAFGWGGPWNYGWGGFYGPYNRFGYGGFGGFYGGFGYGGWGIGFGNPWYGGFYGGFYCPPYYRGGRFAAYNRGYRNGYVSNYRGRGTNRAYNTRSRNNRSYNNRSPYNNRRRVSANTNRRTRNSSTYSNRSRSSNNNSYSRSRANSSRSNSRSYGNSRSGRNSSGSRNYSRSSRSGRSSASRSRGFSRSSGSRSRGGGGRSSGRRGGRR